MNTEKLKASAVCERGDRALGWFLVIILAFFCLPNVVLAQELDSVSEQDLLDKEFEKEIQQAAKKVKAEAQEELEAQETEMVDDSVAQEIMEAGQEQEEALMGGLDKKIDSPVDITGDVTDIDIETGVFNVVKNVKIKYKDMIIQADEANYDKNTGDIFAKGNVTVYRGGQVFRGESFTYNINAPESEAFSTQELRSSFGPIYFETDKMETFAKKGKNAFKAGKTYFTTHDSSHPNFHVKAKKVKIYPNDRIVMQNVTFYAGNTPIFWFPYINQPFNDELGYYFTPGYRSNWGGYLLNRYGFMVGENWLTKVNLDIRTTRGIAGGFEITHLPTREMDEDWGTFRVYYAQDSDPTEGVLGGRRGELDKSRYRVDLRHRMFAPWRSEEQDLYIDFDIHRISDEFFYEDFFLREHISNPRPDNIVNLVKRSDYGEFNLLGRFRVNEFFRSDTRMPEISIDTNRLPIWNTGLYYEGSASFGIIEEKFDDLTVANANTQISNLQTSLDQTTDPATRQFIRDQISNLRASVEGIGFNRFDTYHQISYPLSLGHLDIVPRAGWRLTNYSSIDGWSYAPSSLTRNLGHAGIDMSMKFTKLYENVKNRALGVDQILHTVRPYANLSYIASSVDNAEVASLPHIDRLSASTNLPPINIPQYSPIDQLNEWNVVRLGVSNDLYTKRDNKPHRWFSLNNYFELYFDDDNDQDSSNFFTEIEWNPTNWINLDIRAQVPFINNVNDFTEVVSKASWQPNPYLNLSLSHIFLQDHPFFEASNQLRYGFYTRLNENWGVSAMHRFEFEDSTLEIQQYTIHRDLSSWVASLGAVLYDNRDGDEQYGIVFSMTLKEFPQISIPFDFSAISSFGGE